MGLRPCILILGTRMALKAHILRRYRVEAFVLPAVGLMAGLTVPPGYGLMDIFIELSRAQSLVAGIAHGRHRLDKICPADNAVIAMASLAVLLLYRGVDHALLRESVIFFVAFEACLLHADAAGFARITPPHQRHTYTQQQHIAEITLHSLPPLPNRYICVPIRPGSPLPRMRSGDARADY